MYRRAARYPQVAKEDAVAYDDPRIRWVRATQLLVRLNAFTIVDLEAESTAVH